MPERKRRRPEPASPADSKERPRHIADEPVAEADALDATVKSPVTESGLPVAEQIRKEWDPNKDGGLPSPLRSGVTKIGGR